MKQQMRKWMEKHWGKRCKEYAGGCPCCEAWDSFDSIFAFEEAGFHDVFLGGVTVFPKRKTVKK